MGAYKITEIEEDFNKTIKEAGNNYIFEHMKIIAKKILKDFPDNQERDIAISKLLESALFVKFCLIKEALKMSNNLIKQTKK